MLKEGHRPIAMCFTKWVLDLDWRLLFLIIPSLSLLAFLSLSSVTTTPAVAGPFSSLPSLRSLFSGRPAQPLPPLASVSSTPANRTATDAAGESAESRWRRSKEEVEGSRIAVCLVGGARRFELTGPSIVERVLKEYPNSDLFLHSPVDRNAYKLSLLAAAPRIATVRLFKQRVLPETQAQVRVLSAQNSPNGIQGLVQYFTLVEGCLKLIKAHQAKHRFTYDWIVRTRVDGYWSAPLGPESFIRGQYVVPSGSNYGGLNDRFGVGDFNTSVTALSRISLIPWLDAAGIRGLNSEAAFKAQLNAHRIPHLSKRIPFCIVSDRKYGFELNTAGVPVAALSGPGPLSGAKCRPCAPACVGACVENVMPRLARAWSWTEWRNGSLELCDAHGPWEKGWEKVFDAAVGEKLAAERRKISSLEVKACVDNFEKMRRRAANWDAPPAKEICKLGLGSKVGHRL